MQSSENNMRVSVVIPAYNAARFLAETVQSVRQQTTPVHEIIIVDDGSTDDTAQVVQSLGRDIIYIRQTNTGVSAARNRGIAEARGEIIAFLDADDLWLPEKVSKQLDVFLCHAEVALVAADRAEIDAQGSLLLNSLFKKQGLHALFAELRGNPIPQVLSFLVKINFIPTSSVMIRKSALARIGVFDTDIRYGEDLELWARIASQYAISSLPEVLIHYRQHGNNATQATEKLLLDMVIVMKRIRSWGSKALRTENLNADKAVSQALWDLGYWYFTSNAPQRACSPLLESFRESPSLRALTYAALSQLPPNSIRNFRRLKQKIFG